MCSSHSRNLGGDKAMHTIRKAPAPTPRINLDTAGIEELLAMKEKNAKILSRCETLPDKGEKVKAMQIRIENRIAALQLVEGSPSLGPHEPSPSVGPNTEVDSITNKINDLSLSKDSSTAEVVGMTPKQAGGMCDAADNPGSGFRQQRSVKLLPLEEIAALEAEKQRSLALAATEAELRAELRSVRPPTFARDGYWDTENDFSDDDSDDDSDEWGGVLDRQEKWFER